MSTAIQNNDPANLAPAEAERLEQCEAVIKRGLDTFYEVGSALAEIRESRLYRQTYSTFEGYCQERWSMTRRHVNRLIESADVVTNLGPIGPIPSTESQARELSILSPEEQRAAWQEVIETAPERGITAAHVKHVVENLKTCPVCGKIWMADLPNCPYCNLTADERIEGLRKIVHVSHNSGENEWYTPDEYLTAARSVLGVIDLDPASSKTANKHVKAKTFYTLENDGLTKEWAGRVWMNPPYASDLVTRFVTKLVEHVRELDVPEAIVLVNNATETAWFRELVSLASAIIFPNSRVKFLDQSGEAVGAPLQGQAVVYLGEKPKVFAEKFSKFGWAAWL